MILTGKAKEHFEAWVIKSLPIELMDLDLIFLAYSTKFFDSVGIYINIKTNGKLFQWSIDKFLGAALSRTEASESAIIIANKIYNDIRISKQ